MEADDDDPGIKLWIKWSWEHIWQHLARAELKEALDHFHQVRMWEEATFKDGTLLPLLDRR